MAHRNRVGLRYFNPRATGFAVNSLHQKRKRLVLFDFVMDLTGSLALQWKITEWTWYFLCVLARVGKEVVQVMQVTRTVIHLLSGIIWEVMWMRWYLCATKRNSTLMMFAKMFFLFKDISSQVESFLGIYEVWKRMKAFWRLASASQRRTGTTYVANL